MRFTSTHCDKRECGFCDGTCTYMDQDGPQRLACDCRCHDPAKNARRITHAVAMARRVLVTERIDHLYEVVPRVDHSGSEVPR